jgi:hypothetical protein
MFFSIQVSYFFQLLFYFFFIVSQVAEVFNFTAVYYSAVFFSQLTGF